MKDIRWSRQFTRHYKERIAKVEQLEELFWESIETFVVNPAAVNDHALTGVMQGKRAFSVMGDYRIIYLERDEYYLFLDVGTHEQVYRR